MNHRIFCLIFFWEKRVALLALVLCLLSQFSGLSQSEAIDSMDLPVVQLTALRIATIPRKEPFSIATFQIDPALSNGLQLSLQEYLTELPGLFSLNANNYAQDLRIAIRGFGARSAFGIRGIKIIVDGVPETTPDGQGQLDNLDLSNIERIEVLKGPSSALYGNASGGVINIQSQKRFNKNFIGVGYTAGSFSMQRYEFSAGWKNKHGHLLLNGNRSSSNGFRRQSGFKSTQLDFKARLDNLKWATIKLSVNYTNSPTADDPGGLTIEEIKVDRTQARDRNISYKTGESIDQFKAGITIDIPVKKEINLKLYSFYNRRNFEGKLPFEFGGWIDLNRNYFGNGISFSYKRESEKFDNELLLGIDYARQLDNRKRFKNIEGIRGANTFDQMEQFTSTGIYALNYFTFSKFLFSTGLRFDYNHIQLVNQTINISDPQGSLRLPTLNPSLGINYEFVKNLHLYTNFRTSFETPALSELAADPTGGNGLNKTIQSQQSYNYEIGFKGLASAKIDFDCTLFHINTINSLVPFELEDFPDRTFYRNAGKTNRQGVETWLNFQLFPSLNFRTSYTFSNFKYRSFKILNEDFKGKVLPGIPKHAASFSLNYSSQNGISVRLIHQSFSKYYADNSNENEIDRYHVTHINFGYQVHLNRATLSPFLGVNNIFNIEYFDNVRLNAFGNRYYEPAPGINIYGGVKLRFE